MTAFRLEREGETWAVWGDGACRLRLEGVAAEAVAEMVAALAPAEAELALMGLVAGVQLATGHAHEIAPAPGPIGGYVSPAFLAALRNQAWRRHRGGLIALDGGKP